MVNSFSIQATCLIIGFEKQDAGKEVVCGKFLPDHEKKKKKREKASETEEVNVIICVPDCLLTVSEPCFLQ